MFDLLLLHAENGRATVIGCDIDAHGNLNIFRQPYSGPTRKLAKELRELATSHDMACETLYWSASGDGLILAKGQNVRGPSGYWCARIIEAMEEVISKIL